MYVCATNIKHLKMRRLLSFKKNVSGQYSKCGRLVIWSWWPSLNLLWCAIVEPTGVPSLNRGKVILVTVHALI